MDGGGAMTTNGVGLVAVPCGAVTVIRPVVAPCATVVVIEVEVTVEMMACVPLNRRVLFDGTVASKFVPKMVTSVPTGPLVGIKPMITGPLITVKLVALVAGPPRVVTLIGPVEAPEGTMAVRLVAEAEVTVAVTPLNLTSFLRASGSKLVPVIVTAVPGGPLVGVKLVMVGAATVVNWLTKALSGWPLVSVMFEVSESVWDVPAASGAFGTTNNSRPCSPGLIVAATALPLVSITLVLVSVRTSTGSEKRTPMMSVWSTPVALLGGVTWLTTGPIVSAKLGM